MRVYRCKTCRKGHDNDLGATECCQPYLYLLGHDQKTYTRELKISPRLFKSLAMGEQLHVCFDAKQCHKGNKIKLIEDSSAGGSGVITAYIHSISSSSDGFFPLVFLDIISVDVMGKYA